MAGTAVLQAPAPRAADAKASAGGPSRGVSGDTLFVSVLILVGAMGVQRLIGFGRGVLFCRWLDPEQLGQWDMAFSFLKLAAPVAVLGLPGCFGRYIGYYRQRGQLEAFVRRTTIWTAASALVAVAVMALAAPRFAQLIFGRTDCRTLVVLLAICLGAVIFQYFLESLFTGYRAFRVVSGMQFCQSALFAVLSIVLMWFWTTGAEAVVAAFGASSLVTALATLLLVRRPVESPPSAVVPLPVREFVARLVPFAAWVWLSGLLANLFAMTDRYMLLHYSGLSTQAALADIGNYHSSRLIPLLILSLAALIGSMLTPHLTRDWEAGRKGDVSDLLNLALKLSGLGLLAASILVLAGSPLLFEVAFAGKYASGLRVQPAALACCIWFGLTQIAQNYLWCAERARSCSVPLVLGLALNVALNLWLMPRYGLSGVAAATALSNLAVLLHTIRLNSRAGMHVHAGTWCLAAAPASVAFGLWPACLTLAALVLATLSTDRVFTPQERRRLIAALRRRIQPVS